MISSAFEALLAPVFPRKCQECGRDTPSDLCQGCTARLCEYALSWENAWHPSPIPNIRCAWSSLRYKDIVQSLLRRAKFKHEFYLLKPMAAAAAKLFEAFTAETAYDALIPMPVDFSRRWERRFNQTEILASYLCPRNKQVQTGLLYKRWGFRPQRGLDKDERKWNLFGAFGIRHAGKIRGKKILLIDDIITTGATASEAARVLLEEGARQVDLFGLARSEKQMKD